MNTLAKILVIVLLPAFLILTNVRLVTSPAFVRWQYSRPDFPPSIRINPSERLTNALTSLDFVAGAASEADFRALRVNGQPAWNEREVVHMIDVRNVMVGAFTFHLIAGALLLASILVLRNRVLRPLLYGALATVGLLAVIGVFAAVDFDQFFTLFHAVFFKGDTWLFNYEDTLIQLFPLPFWFDASLLIVGLTIVEALVMGAVAWWGLRRSPARPARRVTRRRPV